MRVLLVSHRFPPDSLSGVERCAQLLATELRLQGDQVTVVARRPSLPQQTPVLRREQLPDGLVVHRFVGGDAGLDTFLDYHERIEQMFELVMREVKPEVVHFHHIKDLSPYLIEIAHHHQAAVVLTLHDFYFACPMVHLRKISGELCDGPDGGLECARTCFAHEGTRASLRWGARAAYFRRLLASAERIITPSHYLANFFTDFGAVAERLCVIPNGITLPLHPMPISTSPRHRDQLNLAFLGSVVDYKGVHLILEALRLVRLDRVRLVVFGQIMNQQYAQQLRKQAAHLPGMEFRLYGAYDQADLPTLLREIDCVIIPSLVPESFSLTAHEALSQGVPVIGTRLGALPEVIVDGQNGFTFSQDNPAELAAILLQLRADPDLLPRLRAGTRQHDMLSATEHTRHVQIIYHEAINTLAHPSPERGGDAAEQVWLSMALDRLGFARLR